MFGIKGMYEGKDYLIFNNSLIDNNKNKDDEIDEENLKNIEKLKYFSKDI